MKLSDIIFPSKRINFFVGMVLGLGIVTGAVFLMSLGSDDSSRTISQIVSFVSNIKTGNVDAGLAFKNSLIVNYVFVFLIWGLGLSVIGIVANVFLCYIKGFVVGFSVGAIMVAYGYKGILFGFLYVFPVQVFNCLVVVILTIYSIMFSKYLISSVFGEKRYNNRVMVKRYVVILIGCCVISLISSCLEVYLFPNLFNLVIGLYV